MTHLVQSWQPHSVQRSQDPRGTLFHMESLAKDTLLSRQRWKRLSSLPLAAFYYLMLILLCSSLLQYFLEKKNKNKKTKKLSFKIGLRTHMLQVKSRGLNLNSKFITRKNCSHENNTPFRVVKSCEHSVTWTWIFPWSWEKWSQLCYSAILLSKFG